MVAHKRPNQSRESELVGLKQERSTLVALEVERTEVRSSMERRKGRIKNSMETTNDVTIEGAGLMVSRRQRAAVRVIDEAEVRKSLLALGRLNECLRLDPTKVRRVSREVPVAGLEEYMQEYLDVRDSKRKEVSDGE